MCIQSGLVRFSTSWSLVKKFIVSFLDMFVYVCMILCLCVCSGLV